MEPILKAVLESDSEVSKLLKLSPQLAQLRMAEDYLVEAIPHWLYVGDTPLHLAAAALKLNAAKLLLDRDADARLA